MLSTKQAFRQAVGRANYNGTKAEKRKIMSQPSFSRKSRNPELFTLAELRKLDKEVHFTEEEALALIKNH